MIYGKLLEQFFRSNFPADIGELYVFKNPAATSCAEDGLIRVLRKYDDKQVITGWLRNARKCIFRCDGRFLKRGEDENVLSVSKSTRGGLSV